MNRTRALLLALCVAPLAACGQKGDLYLPDATREAVRAPTATTAPATPAEEREDTRRQPQASPATN